MRCFDHVLLRNWEVFRLCCNYINPRIKFMVMLCYVMLCFIFACNNQYINIVSLCFTFHVLSCRPDLSCQKLPPGAFPTETRRKSPPGVIRRAQKNAEMLPGEDSDLVLRKPSPSTRYLFWKAICVYPLCVELLFFVCTNALYIKLKILLVYDVYLSVWLSCTQYIQVSMHINLQ